MNIKNRRKNKYSRIKKFHKKSIKKKKKVHAFGTQPLEKEKNKTKGGGAPPQEEAKASALLAYSAERCVAGGEVLIEPRIAGSRAPLHGAQRDTSFRGLGSCLFLGRHTVGRKYDATSKPHEFIGLFIIIVQNHMKSHGVSSSLSKNHMNSYGFSSSLPKTI